MTKSYDETLERAKEYLKESIDIEDDVRRRSTIQVLEYARTLDTYNQYGKADIDKNIAWLEKQDSITELDALIEKAWDWVEDNILSSNQQDKSLLYYKQLKKYIKENK